MMGFGTKRSALNRWRFRVEDGDGDVFEAELEFLGEPDEEQERRLATAFVDAAGWSGPFDSATAAEFVRRICPTSKEISARVERSRLDAPSELSDAPWGVDGWREDAERLAAEAERGSGDGRPLRAREVTKWRGTRHGGVETRAFAARADARPGSGVAVVRSARCEKNEFFDDPGRSYDASIWAAFRFAKGEDPMTWTGRIDPPKDERAEDVALGRAFADGNDGASGTEA